MRTPSPAGTKGGSSPSRRTAAIEAGWIPVRIGSIAPCPRAATGVWAVIPALRIEPPPPVDVAVNHTAGACTTAGGLRAAADEMVVRVAGFEDLMAVTDLLRSVSCPGRIGLNAAFGWSTGTFSTRAAADEATHSRMTSPEQ